MISVLKHLIADVILSKKCHIKMGLIHSGYRVLSIYGELNETDVKKQIMFLLRVTVNCIAQYPCRLFKVAFICLDMFLTPCDQGTCIIMKHCCVNYVFCSNENLQQFFSYVHLCAYTTAFT